MMRDILISRLNARKSEANPLYERTERMPRQPGRIICESLMSLKEEIDETSHLTPEQKADLQSAIKKLWLARGCDKMSIE
jgi:hypothetical protein